MSETPIYDELRSTLLQAQSRRECGHLGCGDPRCAPNRNPSKGEVVVTLPVGMRPARSYIGWDQTRGYVVSVGTDGVIRRVLPRIRGRRE